MSDTYQAVYDAVRSRISNADVGRAIQEGMHLDGSFAIEQVRNAFVYAAADMSRPSVLWRPAISIDGDMWCALYGENLQDGVAGFGKSPADAMYDFDQNWNAALRGHKQEGHASRSAKPQSGVATPPARDAKDDARHVRDYIGKASL